MPTLFLIGDSTLQNGTRGQRGWGSELGAFVDQSRLRIVNRARGGRSSRTFRTEGLWDTVRAELAAGDTVLMQFGHNDGGALTDPRNRASLKGTGEETREVGRETVHTYGWYLRQYVRGCRERGARPLVCSPVPRNIWKDGRVARASADYGRWARDIAIEEGADFLDLHEIVARRYELEGKPFVAARCFGPTDHTHTTPLGARLTAECVALGLRRLRWEGL